MRKGNKYAQINKLRNKSEFFMDMSEKIFTLKTRIIWCLVIKFCFHGRTENLKQTIIVGTIARQTLFSTYILNK